MRWIEEKRRNMVSLNVMNQRNDYDYTYMYIDQGRLFSIDMRNIY